MRTIKLTLTLITLVGLISLAGLVLGTNSNAAPLVELENTPVRAVTVSTKWPAITRRAMASCNQAPSGLKASSNGRKQRSSSN
jgi:hypothetical protein